MLQSKALKQDDSSQERGRLARGLAWCVLITGASLIMNEQKAACLGAPGSCPRTQHRGERRRQRGAKVPAAEPETPSKANST